MKRSTATIAWIFYITGLIPILLFVFNEYIKVSTFPLISFSLVMVIPWIICIVDYIKMDEKKDYLWLIILITFSLPSIPVHLVKRRVKSE
ncbi:MAG: hypothetical protein RBT19_03700 [Tenuifilaceae bacterium]|jgi:hypothetical protein|uniref:hypothetical protein n=1 Tax=Perlabentimonas gracilis TaxID=2715279 RepID=UPI00140C8ACA|nr:hypothetical protein [Perlabentimonas gracilis]MDX9769439.1 hypothetical protein [Tenuifilaceae bacterium]NHB70269.1 hypothetical protein [Perlabentimonas gracilis]